MILARGFAALAVAGLLSGVAQAQELKPVKIGVVNLSTKSGSNQWHGEAHEYLRNKSLNSQGYFDTSKPPWTQNQYGFSLGGRVIKDKTFFFTSWEQFRLRQGQTLTTTVPVAAFRQGDFSALSAAGIQLYDPYTVQANGDRTPYANNQIPKSQFSAVTNQILPYAQVLKPNIAGLVPGTSAYVRNNFITTSAL